MMGVGNVELIVLIVITILILGPKETIFYIRKVKKFILTLKEYKNEIEADVNKQLQETSEIDEKPAGKQ